jgi:hypothetical protein
MVETELKMNLADLTPAVLVEILARNPLRQFTDSDWEQFPDCESKFPRVAYEENFGIILDGAVLVAIDLDSVYADFVEFNSEEIGAAADQLRLNYLMSSE